MHRTNILFRSHSQPGNLTTTFFLPHWSLRCCVPSPRREQLKSTLQMKAGKSWPTKTRMGLKGEGEGGKALKLCCWKIWWEQGSACARAAPTATQEFHTPREWSVNTAGPRNYKTLKIQKAWSWFYVREMHQPISKQDWWWGKDFRCTQVVIQPPWKSGRKQIKTWWGCFAVIQGWSSLYR